MARLFLRHLIFTPAALDAVHYGDALKALERHNDGDWGEISSEDWNRNEWAMDHGEQILSAYSDRARVKFWIVTEADRSVTTILLPDEY